MEELIFPLLLFQGDDGETEWYVEPITIVGFVAGFLLLLLIVASVLILCHSREDDDDEDKKESESRDDRGLGRITEEHDKRNPLYIAANEFNLRPLPSPVRAKFVQIHVDNQSRGVREGFESYYNTGRRFSGA